MECGTARRLNTKVGFTFARKMWKHFSYFPPFNKTCNTYEVCKDSVSTLACLSAFIFLSFQWEFRLTMGIFMCLGVILLTANTDENSGRSTGLLHIIIWMPRHKSVYIPLKLAAPALNVARYWKIKCRRRVCFQFPLMVNIYLQI